MIIGIPKEIKDKENRVAITPAGVKALVKDGHGVFVQNSAGSGSGISDQEYLDAGALLLEDPAEIFQKAEMIMKVKEPLPSEYSLVREGQIVFTYFHFAASRELTQAMIDSKSICFAYETVETDDRTLPLLAPMSEVAGKTAGHTVAYYLSMPRGGRGVLLGGVPGVKPAKIVVVGGGNVGTNAAKVAAGIGANVVIFDVNLNRLKYLDDIMPKNVTTLASNQLTIEHELKDADGLIGAVLIPGAPAPKVVTEEMVKMMPKRSVIIDVAIDQGGCVETSRVTSLSEPTYLLHDVLHYCVPNIPGAFPRTSTFALTNATLPYALEIANKGYQKAIISNPAIAKGLNIISGRVTYRPVAEYFGYEYYPIDELY
ncbi:MAG TPA: alanine dehydrogenase [Atribacterota bacterium]|nr:alanine dehydrogenase [Atribacterota bacterium]HPK87513.1 alanine dehydrogenase [Atribacterota bacterium]